MASKKKRPGDRRRQRAHKRAKGKGPEFTRPPEWAMQELIGVRAWLARLKGAEGKTYPPGWRRGQIKHYTKRVRMLKAEIEAGLRDQKAATDDPNDPPNVA